MVQGPNGKGFLNHVKAFGLYAESQGQPLKGVSKSK